MSQYVGFSTIGANQPKTTNAPGGTGGGVGSITNSINPGKKFKLTDENLVIRDFINALNIRQGEKVGQPSYGTTLWNFVFEPNTPDMQFALDNEIRRVASQDPRILIDYVKALAAKLKIQKIIVFPIDTASGFYLKQGFIDIGDTSFPGYLTYEVKGGGKRKTRTNKKKRFKIHKKRKTYKRK